VDEIADPPDLYMSIEWLKTRKRQKKGGWRKKQMICNYTVTCKDLSSEPEWSKDYLEDDEDAKQFIKDIQPIWPKASQILLDVIPGRGRALTRFAYPQGLHRLAGAWAGCEVNIALNDNPVPSKFDKDTGIVPPNQYSCLTTCGQYEGGDVIFWEAEVIIEMKPGDVLLYPEACIHRSVSETTGVRHSIVASTSKRMFQWFGRRYNRSEREVGLKKYRRLSRRKGNGQTNVKVKRGG